MERVSSHSSDKTNVYVYESNLIFNKKSAVKFLLGIRNKKDILVKHIDLDDKLRNSEGSESTVLSGTVPEARLTNEVISRNIDNITMFASWLGKSFILCVNLRNWEVSIILNVKSVLKVEDLEKYLFA